MAKLTDRTIKAIKEPGIYSDGRGLYLRVLDPEEATGWNWIFRYQLDGTRRRMGLGAYPTIGLADAREEAEEARRKLRKGIDPIDARNAEKVRRRIAAAKRKTFRQIATELIQGKRHEWSNGKHQWQWTASLERYAFPTLGDLPVADIDLGLVKDTLTPIWLEKTETAKRVRQRIHSVMAAAIALGLREGANPADLESLYAAGLPKAGKVQTVKHHAALDYKEVGKFMSDLRKREGMAALALEFAILTAARSGEVRGARWDELDLAKKLWTIPAERMKARKPHTVPLPDAAVAVVQKARELNAHPELVFPSAQGKPLSDMSLLAVLRRMKVPAVPHGFRTTFRTWAAEQTVYPNSLAETALAHVVGSEVQRAYKRTDLLEKRRALMSDWAEFVSRPWVEPKDNVVAIRETA